MITTWNYNREHDPLPSASSWISQKSNTIINALQFTDLSEACLICQRTKAQKFTWSLIHFLTSLLFSVLPLFLIPASKQHIACGGIHSIFTKKTEGIDGKLQLVAYSSSLHRCKGNRT